MDPNRKETGVETGRERPLNWEQQTRHAGEKVREGVESVTERTRGFLDSAKTQAEQAAEYVQGAMEQTRGKLAEYREGGFQKVRGDAVDYTREQPVTALLIAAALGLMIGWLTAAGRRSG